ncbi:MAG: glycosyltransferase [Chloroflexi bacterium]|nr:glycosyltransferase [Chloroflexota bacterium]
MTRRIVLVEAVGAIGGAERIVLDTLRYVDRQRWAATLLILAPEGGVGEEARRYARVVHAPAGRYRNPRTVPGAVWSVAREIVRGRAAIVHANSAKAHIVAGLAARLLRRPSVWHVMDILDAASPLNRLALRLPATRYIAISEAVRDQLVALGVPAPRVQVIYPGLDQAAFDQAIAAIDREDVRAELGLPPDSPLVTLVGRLQRWKGQHVLLAAAPHVLARVPSAHFLIVGDALFGLEPEYPGQLAALAVELGIEGHVHFLGQRHDVPALLHASTVVVHASIQPEAFGLVVLEGMAAGKPVVAARAGGPAEIVVDGVTGRLVPPGDAAALAEALVGLLQAPAHGQQLGAAARASVLARFHAAAAARQVQAVWDELAEPRLPTSRPLASAATDPGRQPVDGSLVR